MTKGIKIDELLNFRWQTQQCGVHDVGQESSQGLHVIAWLCGRCRGHPLVLGGLDKVVDFGIDDLEDTLLGCLLVAFKLLGSLQRN